MFAKLTEQLLAAYVVPVAPYVALTAFPLVGPKLVPINTIIEPPAVPMLLPLIEDIAGGV